MRRAGQRGHRAARAGSSAGLEVGAFVNEAKDSAAGEQSSGGEGAGGDGGSGDSMRELTLLVGLEDVKHEVTTPVNLNKMAAKRKNPRLGCWSTPAVLLERFERIPKDDTFGNGRTAQDVRAHGGPAGSRLATAPIRPLWTLIGCSTRTWTS